MLKEVTVIDTYTPVSKTDSTSLKSKLDNLSVGKFKIVPDLSKLGNEVNVDVVKKLCMIN